MIIEAILWHMGAMTLRHLISERAGVRRAYVLRSLG
jgi:hypothetical protein